MASALAAEAAEAAKEDKARKARAAAAPTTVTTSKVVEEMRLSVRNAKRGIDAFTVTEPDATTDGGGGGGYEWPVLSSVVIVKRTSTSVLFVFYSHIVTNMSFF